MRTPREIFIRAAEAGNAEYDKVILFRKDDAQTEAMDVAVSTFKEDWNEAFEERDDRIKELEGCISELLSSAGYKIGCPCYTCESMPEIYKQSEKLINQKQNEQNTTNS